MVASSAPKDSASSRSSWPCSSVQPSVQRELVALMPYCSAAWHSAWTSRGSRAQADHRPDEAVARGGDVTSQLGSQSQPDADLHSSRDGLAVTVAAVPEQRPRETTGLEASGALCTALACPKAHGTGGQMAHDPAGGIDDGHLHVHRGRDGEGDADVPALGHGLRALGEAAPPLQRPSAPVSQPAPRPDQGPAGRTSLAISGSHRFPAPFRAPLPSHIRRGGPCGQAAACHLQEPPTSRATCGDDMP